MQLNYIKMQVIKYPTRATWNDIIQRPTQSLETIEQKVIPILQEVKSRGDEALKHYSKLFDGVEMDSLEVTKEEINKAVNSVSEELKEAINIAYNNIQVFHRQQQGAADITETMPGVQCWRKSVGIEKVGLYIPADLCGIKKNIQSRRRTGHCSDGLRYANDSTGV